MTEEIILLNPYQHLRNNNEMYFGVREPKTQEILDYQNGEPVVSEMTWVPALYTYWREIVDNALDEIIGFGYGDHLWITYDPETMTFSVEDNGRGIPLDWDPDHKMHKVTLALGNIMAGRNFTSRGETAGVNGIGASGVNFCSEFFTVEVHRDGQKFYQEFKESNAVIDDLQVFRPKITKVKSEKTGTKITFKPSRSVFANMILPEKFIKARVYEIALCNPKLRVHYNGQAVKVKTGNLKNLFFDYKPIYFELEDANFKTKFLIYPNFNYPGEFVHTLVNNIPTINGGSHIDAFRRYFYAGLLNGMERDNKRRKLSPNKSDIQTNLLIFNITTIKAPMFDSQSKTRLTNENIGVALKAAFENEALYQGIIKSNKEWLDQIYERCAERTLKRDANETDKLQKKLSKGKVAGLFDANNKDRSKTILLVAEGDSAIKGLMNARDPSIHAGYPLRGKPMNVNGEPPKKVLENQVLSQVMKAIGLQINQKADRKNLNYGKIYLAHDMDVDGFNIGALLTNFFHYYWPELFDPKLPPIIHVFQTPFIIATPNKAGQKKYWYEHNIDEFDGEKYNKSTGWRVLRAKGLGTLTKEDWIYSLKNPQLYPIIDDGNMQKTLDLIFNTKRADDRKDWLSN